MKGDTLPELSFTIRDSNTAATGKTLDENDSSTWAPINITGATVKLKLREIGSTTVKSTLTCTVTDGAAGKVATDFPVPTLDKAGTFEGEIEITYQTGGIQTLFDLIKFKIRSDF